MLSKDRKDNRLKITITSEAYRVLEVEAMLVGCSMKDVASRLILMGASPKCKEIIEASGPTPETEEKIRKLWRQKPRLLSYEDIAIKVGCSETTVADCINKMKIKELEDARDRLAHG